MGVIFEAFLFKKKREKYLNHFHIATFLIMALKTKCTHNTSNFQQHEINIKEQI